MTEKEEKCSTLLDQVVHKYNFEITDEFKLELPYKHKILKVCIQPTTGLPTMWVSYCPIDPKQEVNFRLVGTGHTHRAQVHIETFFQGPFVWHLFYGIKDW